jgi:hypothetical protein
MCAFNGQQELHPMGMQMVGRELGVYQWATLVNTV